MACNVTAAWRAHRRGAAFANPCYTQIHPTCIPQSDEFQSKLTLMSESLRNDGRIWAPKDPTTTSARRTQIPEEDRDYYLERRYPSFGNLAPATWPAGRPRSRSTRARASARSRTASTSTSPTPSSRLGAGHHRRSATGTSSRCTSASPTSRPTRCPCASTPPPTTRWAALWVDYELMTTVPGLYCRRRGQLQRPRRQPPGRLGPHAGPGRRLLRAAEHHQQLPGPPPRHHPGAHRPPRVPGRRGRGPRALRRLPRHRRHPLARLLPPRAGQDHARPLRHGAHQAGPGEGPLGDPGAARGVPQGPPGHRRRRQRSTRPSRRPAGSTTSSSWPRSCASTPSPARSPAAATSGPSTRPTRARPSATTSDFAHVAAWEWTGDPTAPDPPRRAARPSTTSTSPSGATSSHGTELEPHPQGLAPGRPRRRRPLRHHRRPRHQRRDVVPGDARHRQRAAHRRGQGSRSSSTTTAARASAARAR